VKAVVAFDAQYGGPHRPGYRFADNTAEAAGTAAKEAAYREMVDHVTHAWMAPGQRALHDAERATPDAAPPAGVDEREWARAQMIERTVWKDDTNPTDAMSFLQKSARENSFWQQDIKPPKTDDAALAREQGIRELNEAWRGKQDAAAVPNRPAGAWGQAGLAAVAGDPCMTNAGEAGVLREENGWLYCEA
jgi:hypothetical protein